MNPIEKRLRASIGIDAIHGNSFEQSVCGSQMQEAANEIDGLRKKIERLKAENELLKESNRTYRKECEELRQEFLEARDEVARLETENLELAEEVKAAREKIERYEEMERSIQDSIDYLIKTSVSDTERPWTEREIRDNKLENYRHFLNALDSE